MHLRKKKKKKPTNFQELHSEGPVVVEHAVPFHSPYMNCSASSTAANNLHVIQLSYIGQTLANHLVCNGIAFFAYCLAGQKRTSHGVKLKKRSKLDEEGVHRFRHWVWCQWDRIGEELCLASGKGRQTAWTKGCSNINERTQGKHFWACELRVEDWRCGESMGKLLFD